MQTEHEKNQAVGLYLVSLCKKFDTEKLKLAFEGVTLFGEKLGDWEVVVKKSKKKK